MFREKKLCLAVCLTTLAAFGCSSQVPCEENGTCDKPNQQAENVCGDGIWDSTKEECDGTSLYYGCTTIGKGFTSGVLGCNADCTFDTSGCVKTDTPVCGNSILEEGEECDTVVLGVTCESKGYTKGDVVCSSLCKLDFSSCSNAICGNGTVESDELCDDGDLNGSNGHCKKDCSGLVACGNGILDEGETCDEGAALNGTYGHCNNECTGLGPHCGDGIVQGTEACDGDLALEDTCELHDFLGGTISCNSDCTYNFQGCEEKECETEGESVCDANFQKICEDKKWKWTNCTELGFECLEGACTEVCKTEGVTRCNTTMLEVCNNQRWIASECPQGEVCSDGECLEPCEQEEEIRCTEDGELKVCSNGFWLLDNCDEGLICHEGACLEACNAENGDTTRCSDEELDVIEVCQDGFWIATNCDENYVCDEGICFELCPKNSIATCVDQKNIKICSNALYYTIDPCPENTVCVDSACVPECNINDVASCNEDGSLHFCNENGVWEDKACDEGLGCTAGKCQQTCKETDASSCNPDGTINLCQNGFWNPLPCIEGQACKDGACQNTCELNGEERCTATGQIETCTDGFWIATDCGQNQLCIDDACVESCDPTVNLPLCTADGKLKKCVDQNWTTVICSDYVADQICLNGQCVYECEDTTPTCDGDVLVTCDNHRIVRTDCTLDNKTCEIDSCIAPDPNLCETSVCVDGTLTVCKNGSKFGDPIACEGGCNDTNTDCATGIYCNFQALVHNKDVNFTDATAYGRVVKEIGLTGGGIYCTTDLSLPVKDWTYGAFPETNDIFYDEKVTEWRSNSIYKGKSAIKPGKNYCTFVATFKDAANQTVRYACLPGNHDETKTLPEALFSDDDLYLAESQTRVINNTCGNDSLDEGEQCDGVLLNDKTCELLVPDTTGTLTCNAGCFFDTSKCTPAGGETWDYTEDFTNATAANANYTSTATYANDDVNIDIKARLDTFDTIEAGNQSVILGKKADDNYIKVLNISKGVGKIKFAYKANNASRKVKVTIGSFEAEVKPEAADVVYTYEQNINLADATSIIIEPISSDRRFLIDDLQWTNYSE